uniref:Eukaryotic translation initiation factor 4B n=1 Tax=Solanum tuberosum TaxID=4113 RepID=M1B7E2_SOLTU
MLPTSPRERTAEELGQSRHGGGFRLYGYDREIAPSRADETDDWGAAKKTSAANKAFVPSSGRRFDRRRSFESNGSDSDSDRWTKKEGRGRWTAICLRWWCIRQFNRKKRWVIGFMGRGCGFMG